MILFIRETVPSATQCGEVLGFRLGFKINSLALWLCFQPSIWLNWNLRYMQLCAQETQHLKLSYSTVFSYSTFDKREALLFSTIKYNSPASAVICSRAWDVSLDMRYWDIIWRLHFWAPVFWCKRLDILLRLWLNGTWEKVILWKWFTKSTAHWKKGWSNPNTFWSTVRTFSQNGIIWRNISKYFIFGNVKKISKVWWETFKGRPKQILFCSNEYLFPMNPIH